ncbi:metal ABC transporter permease [Limosilactobacillus fastidiosus]|uniref:Metal ABC transporter permease n=1 Tax=Limosilactobacillus fastidiosus TaxID=2759855 RepID=A0A7W3U060_9LACO|nr:metal ABC transporter permease [Limosilactobacillus fastidiosus]MBB1086496.1 metal ABC transporter permease [Limosilactobacillus fastidiosus]MCD7085152.1 metal ABC transporter permease [Limosilactobacillus fastidiosus]MCD7115084.1 metal ABC transporter permease [Limosilactobacillus fastidiosus]MCD7116232.1 metal ABC transporter permease [Limosilactobacillus fastidiosus]
MLELSFMRHAFIASTFIAIVSGFVGVFVVARNLSFLTHTLSEIGFAGGAFAVFVGWPVLNGMILFTMLSSILVGQMSIKESRREAVTSAVSALFIGLGILFLSLSSKNASSATNILFGSVVGINLGEVLQLICLSIIVIMVILITYRQLKFTSFDAIGARVSGLNATFYSVIFLVILALSVSVAAQIVGSLLIFILLTLPAASAKYFTHGVGKMIGLAILFSLLGTWLGLFLGYLTNWPVSFFIAVIEVIIYCSALIKQRVSGVE